MKQVVFTSYVLVLACLCHLPLAVLTGGADPARNALHHRAFAAASALRDGAGMDAEEMQTLAFLIEYMPTSDLEQLTVGFLLENVQFALQARRATSWASAVPFELFLNEVAPYASLTETRDAWRPSFFNHFMPLVQNETSLTDAATLMNTIGWDIVSPPIKFVASPPCEINNYSPFEVMRWHNASCTGLSVFLVAACRSVGIPARVAGVPHWNLGPVACPNGDADAACGNHNWVEVWVDGGWAFVDEDGQKQLNTSWFFPGDTRLQVPNSRNHSIYAASWAPSNALPAAYYPLNTISAYFPLVWDWANTVVGGWDVTSWYLSKSSVPASDLSL